MQDESGLGAINIDNLKEASKQTQLPKNLPPLAKSPLQSSSKKVPRALLSRDSFRSSNQLITSQSRDNSISRAESVLIHEDESTTLNINASKWTSYRKEGNTDNFSQSSTRNISTFDRNINYSKAMVVQQHQQKFAPANSNLEDLEGERAPPIVKKKTHQVAHSQDFPTKFSPFRS